MNLLSNLVVRRTGTLEAALLGPYLLYLAANPESRVATALFQGMLSLLHRSRVRIAADLEHRR